MDLEITLDGETRLFSYEELKHLLGFEGVESKL